TATALTANARLLCPTSEPVVLICIFDFPNYVSRELVPGRRAFSSNTFLSSALIIRAVTTTGANILRWRSEKRLPPPDARSMISPSQIRLLYNYPEKPDFAFASPRNHLDQLTGAPG